MSTYLVLAQSDVTARALGVWLELLGEPKMTPEDPRRIVWDRELFTSREESGEREFQWLVSRVERASGRDDGSIPLNEVVVLVDSVNPWHLSAIAERVSWDHLLAMLILTFPELNWVFGVVTGRGSESCFHEHSLVSLLTEPRRDPLLDPTGLREWVRQRTNHDLKDRLGSALPIRRKRAASIEEEKNFAYFHGYTAFRYGFRTDVVVSWALMRKLFATEDGRAEKGHGYELLLEDMSLNFSDKRHDLRLLDLESQRAPKCPKLDATKADQDDSKFRILITTGQDSTHGEEILKRNRRYLREKKVCGCGLDILKPIGGMLDLWSKAGLYKSLHESDRLGNAKDFIWPPRKVQAVENQRESGHGAPGKLMLLAETLLRRAMDLQLQARTVQDFIKGAVLAMEAAEILSSGIPTLTLEALALKHEYEAKAECAFIGAGYHLDVRRRAEEIADEVKAVARRFAQQKRQASELNARIVIMNHLARVFREAGQFEEEQECMVCMRRCHRRLVGLEIQNPLYWVTNSILWYAELLLASFPRFVLAIVAWLGASTAVWRLFVPENQGWKSTISGVWSAFFSGSPATITTDTSWFLIGVSCVIVTAGFFHLGVFMAYIYSLISRK